VTPGRDLDAMDRDPTAAALANAAALRARLQQALLEARQALTAAEETNHQLHRELARMTTSRGRRLFVRARTGTTRAVNAIRHPLWTAGTVVRGLAAAPAPATASRALQYLVRRVFPLRLTAPTRRSSEGNDETIAIRWIGPINLRHQIREALLCHPPASVEYRTRVPAGARFVCDCALSPQVWQSHPPAITFTVGVEIPATGWRDEVSISIDPGARWTDRRWHPVVVNLPPAAADALDVVVTLSTRVPEGGNVGNAWALFGEPRFEWRRHAGEVRRSLRTFASRVRTDGIQRSLELLRTAGISTQDAEAYPRWVAKHTRSEAALEALRQDVSALPYQPLVSIVTPVYNTDPRWLRAAIDSVRRQVYPNWQLCLCDDASTSLETVAALREYEGDPRIRIRYMPSNGGISAASNAALELADGDYVALLDHDDELTPDALAEVVRHLNAHPEAEIVYSDEDKLDLQGNRCDAYFKPDWSLDHFLTCMYTCHLMVARRQLVTDAGGFRVGYEGAQDYDLVLRMLDRLGERTSAIHHVPRVLYHWRKLPESTASAGAAKPWAIDAGRRALDDYLRRNAVAAEVLPGGGAGLYRVRRAVRGRPLVSIVIPTAGKARQRGSERIDMLAQAIRSIVHGTSYDNYEIIIVLSADPGGTPSLLDSSLRALEGTRHRIVRFERVGLFNFAASINTGAAAAAGDHLLLLNDDVEAITPEWMTAMLELSQEQAIGAVGPKLLYPDGRLQHIGIVLGVAGVAAHAFHQHPGVSPGYGGSAMIVRNYSAVTGACLMTRREVFEQVGRFDERFPTDFNDIDYCLRLRQAGYRVVFTPWAQLYHHESASFGIRSQDFAALAEMRRRWAAVIDNDPFYNPNLTRDFPDYRLDA
jgi:GT2 family glycosyltransferase